jgi:hypothetical protein
MPSMLSLPNNSPIANRPNRQVFRFAFVLWAKPPVAANLTVLTTSAPFDAYRWINDSAYRISYLARAEPGRVWQSAHGSSTTPKLVAYGSRSYSISPSSGIDLTVTGPPYCAPVTFTCFGDGSFSNGFNTITIQASGTPAVATAHFTSPGQIDRTTVLASSPMAVGQVRFLVRATP